MSSSVNRDSVESDTLQALLASLRIGRYAKQQSRTEDIIDLSGKDSLSDTEEVTSRSTRDEDVFANLITPVTMRPTEKAHKNVEIVNLVDSSSESDEDDDGEWVIPSTARKPINLIASSSDEEEESNTEYGPKENMNRSALLLPSLNAVLNRPEPPFSNTNRLNELLHGKRPEPKLPTALQQKPNSHAAFNKTRESLARQYYTKYNELVFNGQLPSDMEITWNKRLATTAGLTHYRREVPAGLPPRYIARIELSSKVLDTAEKLERTLVHEMCHCAAWLIDHVAKPPHGPVFKKWASNAMRSAPHLDVSTCHQYEIFYSHQWQCTACQQIYGRHSNSIDVNKKVCGICRGKLTFLGKFQPGGTPAKKRAPTGFNLYVKENFAAVKADLGPGKHASEVMKELTARWKAKQGSGNDNNISSSEEGSRDTQEKKVDSMADLLRSLAL